jgi:uncharacterized damage-inducible protein DinB
MIYKNVGELYEAMDKTRDALKQRISALSDEQLTRRESEKGWSVAEIVEHLVTVEYGGLRIAEKLLRQSGNSENQNWNGEFSQPLSFVEQANSIKERKLEAPERVHPSGAQSVAESLAKMDENRRALKELRPRLEATDISGETFPHPFFGDLTAYQWLAVVGLHERRHLAQIERILAQNAESN